MPNITAPHPTEHGARSRCKCVFKQRPTDSGPSSSPTHWTGSTKSSCPNSLNRRRRPRRTARAVPKATVQNHAKTSGHPSNPLRPSENHRSQQCFFFQRTLHQLAIWRKLGVPPSVLSWLSWGAPLLWNSLRPLPSFDHGAYQLSPDERTMWKDLRAKHIETRAIRPIQKKAASHISRAFLVTKPMEDGVRKFCLVIELRKVNMHLSKTGLHYKRLRDFGQLLRWNDWMVGFDIKNAYHHLHVRDAQ